MIELGILKKGKGLGDRKKRDLGWIRFGGEGFCFRFWRPHGSQSGMTRETETQHAGEPRRFLLARKVR